MSHRYSFAMPALALAAAVAMVGCTGGEKPGGTGDAGESVSGAATASGDASPVMVLAFEPPDSDDMNLQLPSEGNLRDLAPLEILDVADDDPQRLILAFEMGSHHCYGVHLALVETETVVSLQLRFGLRPGVLAASCGFGVYPYTAAAALSAPLGDRQLILTGPSGTVGNTSDANVAGGDAIDGGAADGAVSVADPDPPIWFNPSATEPDEVGRYLGRHVEEAVEWAEFHDRAWRILTFDGIPINTGGPEDPERVSFVVEGDVIVSYEWS